MNVFERKRLFLHLDRNVGTPIIWVCGPAHSGKTTLIQSYIRHRELPNNCYQMDDCDGDIATFLLQRDMGETKLSQDLVNPVPERILGNPLPLQAFSKKFFAYFYGNLKAPSLIVFDNFQKILSETEIVEFICNGLLVVPKGITVIIISRNKFPQTMSPLRTITKIINWDNFRLTMSETKRFTEVLGYEELTMEYIQQLYKMTAGWIFGVSLILKSFNENEKKLCSTCSETLSRSYHYFAKEIIHGIDNQTLDFMCKTAFVPQFTIQMAKSLTGSNMCKQILTHLILNYCFIEKKDGITGSVYEYHPMFRESLLFHVFKNYSLDEFIHINRFALKQKEGSALTSDADEIFKEFLDKVGVAQLLLRREPSSNKNFMPLQIYTLGRFEIFKYGKRIEFLKKTPQKPLLMLKMLIAFGSNGVRETRISDFIWPDIDGDKAHNDFKTTLRRLRQLVGIDNIFNYCDQKIALNSDICWVDIWGFDDISNKADEAEGNRERGEYIQLLEKAITLYRGNFLDEDGDESWLISLRELLRNRAINHCIKLGRHYEEKKQYKKAIDCYKKGIQIHDLAETLYQKLMLSLHKIGNNVEAIEVYHSFKRALLTAQIESPSPETESIRKSIQNK